MRLLTINITEGSVYTLWILATPRIKQVDVFLVDAQQVTVSFYVLDSNFYLTFIYRCISHVKRRVLWHSLAYLSLNFDGSCIVLEDFNVMLGAHEKIGLALSHLACADF